MTYRFPTLQCHQSSQDCRTVVDPRNGPLHEDNEWCRPLKQRWYLNPSRKTQRYCSVRQEDEHYTSVGKETMTELKTRHIQARSSDLYYQERIQNLHDTTKKTVRSGTRPLINVMTLRRPIQFQTCKKVCKCTY